MTVRVAVFMFCQLLGVVVVVETAFITFDGAGWLDLTNLVTL